MNKQKIKHKQPLKKVGQYRLMKRIGSGATSQVFLGQKQNDPFTYAIKMIRLKNITQNQKQMILKQISIIKSIQHPNIVKLYDTIFTSNNYYLVFQNCQKGDLQKYLKQYFGPLIPQQTVQKIIYCLADAIRVIHSKGIVHRDIKLANILLTKDFVIKLADFGFAKEIQSQDFMLKTYCGTPITMAPQILMNKLYDKKCDIWSLGVIIYQLIYGKLPFAINQGYNKFVQRVIKQPIKIPNLPQMSADFKELLQTCLQKQPQNRCDIQFFMKSQWILQGKDKKIEQRNKQIYQDMTQILKNISSDFDQTQHLKNKDQNSQQQILDKQKQLQKNKIIEQNIAEKLYHFIKAELQKIIQCHVQNRNQIYQNIQKQLKQSIQQVNIIKQKQVRQCLKCQYQKMLRLLFYLDCKYINFLKQLKIQANKQNMKIQIKIQDINKLQVPPFLYEIKNDYIAKNFKFNQSQTIDKNNTNTSQIKKQIKQKIQSKQNSNNIQIGQIFQSFLKSTNLSSDQINNQLLERKKQNYKLIQKYSTLLRSYNLNINIIFGHYFYHHEQVSLQQIYKILKQINKQSLQQNSNKLIQLTQNEQSSQKQHIKRQSNKLNNKNLLNYKYNKYSNFITISMQYHQLNPKLKELRENMKAVCQKMIDQINKTIQGYYY